MILSIKLTVFAIMRNFLSGHLHEFLASDCQNTPEVIFSLSCNTLTASRNNSKNVKHAKHITVHWSMNKQQNYFTRGLTFSLPYRTASHTQHTARNTKIHSLPFTRLIKLSKIHMIQQITLKLLKHCNYEWKNAYFFFRKCNFTPRFLVKFPNTTL